MGGNFDRQAERNEEAEQKREDTELAVQELKKIIKDRICVFLNEDGEIMHGRLMGMMVELDSLILRDLRPGRELQRCTIIVPYDNIKNICTSPGTEACKNCPNWREMQELLNEFKMGVKGRAGEPSDDPNGDASGGPLPSGA